MPWLCFACMTLPLCGIGVSLCVQVWGCEGVGLVVGLGGGFFLGGEGHF